MRKNIQAGFLVGVGVDRVAAESKMLRHIATPRKSPLNDQAA